MLPAVKTLHLLCTVYYFYIYYEENNLSAIYQEESKFGAHYQLIGSKIMNCMHAKQVEVK